MFNDLDKMKEKGTKTYQASRMLEGKVGILNNEVIVGEGNLTDLINEVVICYGKEVKIEINVEVKL